MGLTFKISGKNFGTCDKAGAYMNSTIVEYIEGIEVIKAFGRAGVSYEKYAKAITDFRTFVVKWLSSTYLTMKLRFALFPSTLIGTLPVALALVHHGTISASKQPPIFFFCCSIFFCRKRALNCPSRIRG